MTRPHYPKSINHPLAAQLFITADFELGLNLRNCADDIKFAVYARIIREKKNLEKFEDLWEHAEKW